MLGAHKIGAAIPGLRIAGGKITDMRLFLRKNNVEHRNCNPGDGVCFAALLGSGNSYTTPSKISRSDRKPSVGVVYV